MTHWVTVGSPSMAIGWGAHKRTEHTAIALTLWPVRARKQRGRLSQAASIRYARLDGRVGSLTVGPVLLWRASESRMRARSAFIGSAFSSTRCGG